MNRHDLQVLSATRRREARVLLGSNEWSGAYYLVGYAVECALKACIAKNTRRYEFPDRDLANQAYVHDLEKLLKLAGLYASLNADRKADPKLSVNWTIIKDWSESSRYDHSTSRVKAEDLYSACVARKSGVLSWIKRQW